MLIQIMRNRILSAVLVICLILSMMPVTVNADEGSTSLSIPDGLTWDTSAPGIVKAKWNVVENASYYFVYLYHNGSYKSGVGYVLTNEASFNMEIFDSYGSGNYTFTVIALTEPASGFTDSASSAHSSPYIYTKSDNDCAIGSNEYDTLVNAINAARGMSDKEVTIKLLRNITRYNQLRIEDKDIIFDLSGYNLLIDTSSLGGSVALEVEKCSVGYSGPGTFVVCGSSGELTAAGVKVQQGGRAAVSEILIKTEYGRGAWALDDGSKITVNGNIQTVGGLNSTRAVGADARMGAEIYVNGAISLIGDNCTGAYTEAGGKVTVTPTIPGYCIFVKGDYAVGAFAHNDPGSEITVNGSIRAEGESSGGAYVEFGMVTVHGDVAVEGNTSYGVLSRDTGHVQVNGHVTVEGSNITGVRSEMGEGSGGTIRVTKNVVISAMGGEANIGVYCWTNAGNSFKSTITVDGAINAPLYIEIDGELRDNNSADGNDDAGYWVYKGTYGSIVKIGNGEIAAPAYAPTVVTNAVTGITTSSAILSGNVTNNGGDTVTERGFLFGTDSVLTTSTAIKAGSGTETFTSPITGLEENKTYYVCAYAVNSKGTGYGAIISFTASSTPVTPPPSPGGSSRSLPIVVTKSVSDITQSTASLSGSITSDGGATVTERGFVYGQNKNPSAGGSGVVKVTSGKGTGSFTALAEKLDADTTYHVRAYAVNSVGTSYGEDMSFNTTKAYVPAGEIGWLDASGIDLSNTYGNVVLYTDEDGVQHILGLGIIIGDMMKYVSRGQGKYEIIYNAKPFDDIADHWAKNDIDFSSARLLFSGVTPRIFSPDTHMTRGMFAAVLGRMCGADPMTYMGNSFEDVSAGMYYAPYVKWASDNGIIFGMSDRLFEPERAVTRQEMAAMIQRFMKYLGLELKIDNTEFSDAAFIDTWAKDGVMMLKGTGIITGKSGNIFDPDSISTRAEVAAVLRRLIEYILK